MDMGEWGWFAVAAGGITAVCFAVISLTNRGSGKSARLVSTDGGESHAELLLGDMTDVLARGLPGTGRDQEEILPELVRAGVYRPAALAEYRALRAVLILAPLFVAVAASLLLEPRHMPYALAIGAAVSVLGFSLPRVYITMRAASRSREIERGLPVFADMLSIALLSGQGLTGAMRRVTDQIRNAFPRMAEELEIVIRQTDMLSLAVAFEQWANRSQLPDVRNLSVILNQSQRLGNDVSAALMEYATSMRTGARQRADAKAQRASFWMIFPTILCLWIPATVILVGPLYFEFTARRARAREQAPSVNQLKLLNPPQADVKQPKL